MTLSKDDIDKDPILSDYRDAYVEYHGREPVITRRGSWYRVDKAGPWRKKQFTKLASNLRERKEAL